MEKKEKKKQSWKKKRKNIVNYCCNLHTFSPHHLDIVIIFYVFLFDAPTQTNNTYNPVSLVFPL